MKISFRQVEKEDLPLLRDWRNQERVRKCCREYRLLNMANQVNWFEKNITSGVDHMFIVAVDDEPVGVCGLTHINWKNRSTEIAYYLGRQISPAADVAIGIEVYSFIKKKAFEEYNMNRVTGEAFSFNKGAIDLALKCGFRKEGIMRQSVFWSGKYWDSVLLGMLAHEYFEEKKKNS